MEYLFEYLKTLPLIFQLIIIGVVLFVCSAILLIVFTNIFKSGFVLGPLKVGRRRPKHFNVGVKKTSTKKR